MFVVQNELQLRSDNYVCTICSSSTHSNAVRCEGGQELRHHDDERRHVLRVGFVGERLPRLDQIPGHPLGRHLGQLKHFLQELGKHLRLDADVGRVGTAISWNWVVPLFRFAYRFIHRVSEVDNRLVGFRGTDRFMIFGSYHRMVYTSYIEYHRQNIG